MFMALCDQGSDVLIPIMLLYSVDIHTCALVNLMAHLFLVAFFVVECSWVHCELCVSSGCAAFREGSGVDHEYAIDDLF